MENKIRVSSGIKITVNDNGDTITINAEDQNFMSRFMELNDNLQKMVNELNSTDMKGKSQREQLNFLMDKTKEIMAGIDEVFGKDACKKVFGDIIPSSYLIADFFEQLMPIAKQYVSERREKINEKYNGSRKGARSKKRNRYRTKEQIIQDAMR